MIRVAFLGLGAIGKPMASHLQREPFSLVVWNRTSDKAAAFVREFGGTAAATPAEAVREAEFIVTCLPSSIEVEALIGGHDGLLKAIRPGSMIVDCTSGDPAASRRLAAALQKAEIDFLDAPVSGGVKGAVAGRLTIMCGGTPQSFERAKQVLDAFGERIIHCGPVGAGHAVKAMNQALLAVHIWSAGEALASLAKLGVEPRVALDVINGSSGRSNSSENLFPERVLGRRYPRTFRLSLLDKDVRIASEIARETGVPSPFVDLAARLFAEAHAELGDDADHVEAVRVIEKRAGTEIS